MDFLRKNEAEIPLQLEQTVILRHCMDSFCNAVQAKFNCTAIVNNMEGGQQRTVHAGEMRYCIELPSKVNVSVWKNDLTRHKVDAVVNAANGKLSHDGGLALALVTAGGQNIQNWSNTIIKQKGLIATGEAVVTPAGNLPCDYIIHAVGPCVPFNPSKLEMKKATFLLHCAIKSILEIVVRENYSSVAIPAVSSGLFHFPRDLCADVILKTIKQFDEYNGFQGRSVKVHLVNNDEPSVQEMERAAKNILGNPTVSKSYSRAETDTDQNMSLSLNKNMTLHLKKGLIEEEKVDVIVNTIAKDRELQMGQISSAIFRKAGHEIQKEIKGKKSPDLSQFVYVTKGYGLSCKNVYHAISMPFSDVDAEKILHEVVTKCLEKALLNFQSISFPAIGTGFLAFPKQHVARIMINAVEEFAKQNQKKKLDINFVVFPKDDEMIKEFQKKIKQSHGQTRSPDLFTNDSSVVNKESTEIKTPTVKIIGLSVEAVREAQVWICSMLYSKSFHINNNHVLHLGQREHENLLSLQTKFGVHIKVVFKNGTGCVIITGPLGNVNCVAIELESMLCKAQEDFVRAEEADILSSIVRWQIKDLPHLETPEFCAYMEKALQAGKDMFVLDSHIVNFSKGVIRDPKGKASTMQRTCLLGSFNLHNSSFYSRTPVSDYPLDKKKGFEECGLRVVKVEYLENMALEMLYRTNYERVAEESKLYQCIRAQFCDSVCKVGFQKEFAPPTEQKWGSGIYFSNSVDGALKLWNGNEDELYIYIVQAKVLTGKSEFGSPDLILPPRQSGGSGLYNSLTDCVQTHVIFNGQQALPEYLFICEKKSTLV